MIAALIALIGLSYLCELAIAPPDWHAALVHTFVPQLRDRSAIALTVGIVGRRSCRTASTYIPG